jgi:hypothetical protein
VALDQAEQAFRPKKRRKGTKSRDAVDSAAGSSRAAPSTSSNVRADLINSLPTASIPPPIHEAGPTYQAAWRVNPVPYQIRDLPALTAAPIQTHQNRLDMRPSFSFPANGHSSSQPSNPADSTTATPSSTNLGSAAAMPRSSSTSAHPVAGVVKQKPFPAPQAPQAPVLAPITRRPFPLDFDGARFSRELKSQGSSMPSMQSIPSVDFG